MPAYLTIHLVEILCALGGLFLGWLITFLIARGKQLASHERLIAEERHTGDLEKRLSKSQSEANHHEQESQTYRNQLADLNARLETEMKAAGEKQALLESAEIKLAATFKALSADALQASTEQFLHLAKSSLAAQTEEAKGEIEKRKVAIEGLIQPVAQSLGKFELRVGEIEKAREGAYASLQEQIRALGEGQLGLQRETATLVKALRQPTGRGQWGEIQLRRVVELAGMQQHCDFQLQQQTTSDEGKKLRPDLIVRLPGGRTIVVDSKTPMDGYLDALETNDDVAREEALQRHARQVRTHIQQLSSKSYFAQYPQTPEFVVLFLPSESFFSAALQYDPSLIECGVDKGVILATPTTLIALLRAVAFGWRQESIADNAREISELGRTLHERLSKLTDHFAKLGKSLSNAVESYNQAMGSYESRVLTQARRFQDLKATNETAQLPNLTEIDTRPRTLQLSASPPQIEPVDDFAFVPDQPANARNAAADLRSALE